MTRWCRYLLNSRQRRWPIKWWWARLVCVRIKDLKKGLSFVRQMTFAVYDDGFVKFILFNMIVQTRRQSLRSGIKRYSAVQFHVVFTLTTLLKVGEGKEKNHEKIQHLPHHDDSTHFKKENYVSSTSFLSTITVREKHEVISNCKKLDNNLKR